MTILRAQVPSGSPPQGGEQEKSSKQVFDGFSHNCECFLIKKADFVYQSPRVNKSNLRHECDRWFPLYQSDRNSILMPLWRCCKRNNVACISTHTPNNQNRSLMLNTSAVL